MWIKTKHGDVGRFTYILKFLEQDKPLYQSDQTYMFEKLEQQRFQHQYSHLSSINKNIQSLHEIQLEYSFISEQIQIKQAELDEITSKIKSMQKIPTENYLISEQIQIKQAELDEITSKIKSMQKIPTENYPISEQIQIKQAELDEITSKIKSMQKIPTENYPISEQIQIKQGKFQTSDKQIHNKTSDLDKKIREKNILFNSIGKQYDKHEQQDEAFLFLSKLRNDVKKLQSDKSKLDKKINTIKEALKIFNV